MTSKRSCSPLLARGGFVAGARGGLDVVLVDLRDGTERAMRLPDDADGLVLSPDGGLLLATGLDGVSTLDTAGQVIATARTNGPVARAAITDEGFAAAVDRHDVDGPALYAWRGSQLVPVTAEPTALGEVHAEGFDVDDATTSVVLWGALEAGDRFVNIVTVDDDGAHIAWSGGGLPIEPQMFRFTTAHTLVVHDRHRIAIVDIAALAGGTLPEEGLDASVVAVDDVAVSGVSPNGRYVVWGHSKDTAGLVVASVQLPAGTRREHGELPDGLSSELVAISNEGVVTVAAATGREEVGIWSGSGARLDEVRRLRPRA